MTNSKKLILVISLILLLGMGEHFFFAKRFVSLSEINLDVIQDDSLTILTMNFGYSHICEPNIPLLNSFILNQTFDKKKILDIDLNHISNGSKMPIENRAFKYIDGNLFLDYISYEYLINKNKFPDSIFFGKMKSGFISKMKSESYTNSILSGTYFENKLDLENTFLIDYNDDFVLNYLHTLPEESFTGNFEIFIKLYNNDYLQNDEIFLYEKLTLLLGNDVFRSDDILEVVIMFADSTILKDVYYID